MPSLQTGYIYMHGISESVSIFAYSAIYDHQSQELELFDSNGGDCQARKGTSTTVPTMLSPTVTVSPPKASFLLIYPKPKWSDSFLPSV